MLTYPSFWFIKGTKAVKGICLNMAERGERPLRSEGFGEMHDLRLFKLHHPHYEENNMNKVRVRKGLKFDLGEARYLSRLGMDRVHVRKDLEFDLGEARYLCWHGCTLDSLQLKLGTKHLVALDMSHAQVVR